MTARRSLFKHVPSVVIQLLLVILLLDGRRRPFPRKGCMDGIVEFSEWRRLRLPASSFVSVVSDEWKTE